MNSNVFIQFLFGAQIQPEKFKHSNLEVKETIGDSQGASISLGKWH